MEAPRNTSLLALIITIMLPRITSPSFAQDDYHNNSFPPSSCGNIHNISYPFRLDTDPFRFGFETNPLLLGDYVLSCDNNLAVLDDSLVLQAINYNNYTIRVVDYNIHKNTHNCSAIPPYLDSDSVDSQFLELETKIRFGHVGEQWRTEGEWSNVHHLTEAVLFLSCEKPVQNSSYIPTAPCINSSILSRYSSHFAESRSQYSYVVYGTGFRLSDLADSCLVYNQALIQRDRNRKNITSYMDIYKEFVHGFEISWVQRFAQSGEHLCYVDVDSNKVHCLSEPHRTRSSVIDHAGLIERLGKILHKAIYFLSDRSRYVYVLCLLEPRTAIGVAFVIALTIYKWRRRHLSVYVGIEEFLQNLSDLMPIRYSYHEVRQMTEDFRNKLGKGGFGSVYKGVLRSGHLVAVKMLGNSKANGQDFINEVATIGRIHHVNVVRLVGFCVEGSKRALIYDFMPNGSLDKFIFAGKAGHNSLNSKRTFTIAVGIARGIEYLHRGCNMQILHFDIKPHNVLLDENFVPKISDFGLARLCSLNNNTVSLTAARGTIGYIAPELFYKNIGGVSSKADVYSFGMLLMEMVNRRKNLNANADNSSQIYFPSWIYDRVSKGKDIAIENASEEKSMTMKKMIIVALWCIQLKPCDRPSMSEVIEMLEGEVECLQMPPKPCLYPQENHNAEDAGEGSKITCSSSSAQSDEDSQDIN